VLEVCLGMSHQVTFIAELISFSLSRRLGIREVVKLVKILYIKEILDRLHQ
jgi:hypothetical protein